MTVILIICLFIIGVIITLTLLTTSKVYKFKQKIDPDSSEKPKKEE